MVVTMNEENQHHEGERKQDTTTPDKENPLEQSEVMAKTNIHPHFSEEAAVVPSLPRNNSGSVTCPPRDSSSTHTVDGSNNAVMHRISDSQLPTQWTANHHSSLQQQEQSQQTTSITSNRQETNAAAIATSMTALPKGGGGDAIPTPPLPSQALTSVDETPTAKDTFGPNPSPPSREIFPHAAPEQGSTKRKEVLSSDPPTEERTFRQEERTLKTPVLPSARWNAPTSTVPISTNAGAVDGGHVAKNPRSSSLSIGAKKRAKESKHTTAGRWTPTEHSAFLHGLQQYGREWKKVATLIPTRSSAQVRSHAQKYFAKLQRENVSGSLLQQTVPAAEQSSLTSGGSLEDLTASPQLTESVRAQAARILAEPSTVHAEVERTMDQLRARYRELQQQLQERRRRRRQRENQARIEDDQEHQGGDEDELTTSTHTSLESLQNEELIALHVLHGGLGSSSPNSPKAKRKLPWKENDSRKKVSIVTTTPTRPSGDDNVTGPSDDNNESSLAREEQGTPESADETHSHSSSFPKE